MKNVLVYISICLFSFELNAQQYIPWESHFWRDTIGFSDSFNYEIHRSIHPRINSGFIHDSVSRNLDFKKKLFLMPLSDFVFGDSLDHVQHRNGLGFAMDYFPVRGLQVKLGLLSGMSDNNSVNYLGGVYPNAIVRKPYGDARMFAYQDIRARISYSPNKYFNFQVGIDNNRFGEGDRSLFLDDYGTPYPFAQMRLNFWRFQYVSMQTYLQNPSNPLTSSTRPKYSAMHYLSMNLSKKWNLSFFEVVVYDGLIGNQKRGFEWDYVNPFVIYRPIEFTHGSTDKVQMGFGLSYRINKAHTLYGQFMFDEFKIDKLRERKQHIANKFGYQLGVKGDFTLWNRKLFYLTEFNLVRPYTYGHANHGQTFSNMNTPLAHPLGSNFIENSTRLSYKLGAFDLSLDFVSYLKGLNFQDSINWGGDINISTTLSPVNEENEQITEGFYIGIGNKTNLSKIQATVGYAMIPKYRTRLFITLESLWFTQKNTTTYYQGFFFGLRSELWNDRRNY